MRGIGRGCFVGALALLGACYLSAEPPECQPVGICLADHPCWCRPEAEGWRRFPFEDECGEGCEFRWGAGTVDPDDYCIEE